MKLDLKEACTFSLLGCLMFVSKLLTECLPNVHLLAMLIVVYTVIWRRKALYPIAVFILLTGVYAGFNPWWIPYFYIWPLLWLAVLALPRHMKPLTAGLVYMTVAGLHGLLYGTMYAPAQAVMYGLDLRSTVAWILAGLPWDALQGASNFCVTALAVPCIHAIKKALKIPES